MKTATAPLPPLRSVKVLDQLRERIRYLHYSLRTEQAYVHWVRAFIRFHGVRHPATLGSSEVEAFLSWLANERKVSVSTHRQALAASLFFYGKVLTAIYPMSNSWSFFSRAILRDTGSSPAPYIHPACPAA